MRIAKLSIALLFRLKLAIYRSGTSNERVGYVEAFNGSNRFFIFKRRS